MLHIFNAQSAKSTARSLEKFLLKKGLTVGHCEALNWVAGLCGYSNWNALQASLTPEAIDATLDPMSLTHLQDNVDTSYGNESVIVAHNGFQLRCDVDEELLSYVRVCDPLGREIAYWQYDEWQEDPQLVMGAILGALSQGTAIAAGPDAKKAEPKSRIPAIQDVPFEQVSSVLINDVPYKMRYLDSDVLSHLYEKAPDDEDELDAEGGWEFTVMELSLPDDFEEVTKSLYLSDLRTFVWDSQREAFFDANGIKYEFYIETKFSR